MDNCPICTDDLVGNVATLGCCKQLIHVECLVKCMKEKLDCPMCRYHHESLRMVQDIESQVLVSVEFRNKTFFRNIFVGAFVTTIIILSVFKNLPFA